MGHPAHSDIFDAGNATYFLTLFITNPDMAQVHRIAVVNGLRFGLIDEVVAFWPLFLRVIPSFIISTVGVHIRFHGRLRD